MVFYLLILCCLLSDITYAVLIVATEVNFDPLVTLLPPTFKFALGIEQLWMMLELSMRVNQVICGIRDRHNSADEEKIDALLSGRILCMRKMVLAAILSFLLSILIWGLFLVKQDVADESVNFASIVFGCLFGLLCVSLLVTTVYLACRLAQQRKLIAFSKSAVRKETCFLLTILFTFSLSYLLRIVFDLSPDSEQPDK